MEFVALALFILALVLFWQSSQQQAKAGLPGGRVIYNDARDGWNALEKPLFDNDNLLTGKPDYLVEQGDSIIPVEVKSGKAPNAPYDSHIYQAAAYCLLVQKTMGKRPPYAIIHYEDRDFAIDYTPELESSLLDLLAEMRRDELQTEVIRSHDAPGRCARCGYREICEENIAN